MNEKDRIAKCCDDVGYMIETLIATPTREDQIKILEHIDWIDEEAYDEYLDMIKFNQALKGE